MRLHWRLVEDTDRPRQENRRPQMQLWRDHLLPRMKSRSCMMVWMPKPMMPKPVLWRQAEVHTCQRPPAAFFGCDADDPDNLAFFAKERHL